MTEHRPDDGRSSATRPRTIGSRRMARPRAGPARDRDPHRRLRHLRQRLQVLVGRDDVLGGRQPAGSRRRWCRATSSSATSRSWARARPRISASAVGDRVIAEQIVPVRALPLLPLRQVLDVRGAQHLRLPARGRRWRHGRVHAHPADGAACIAFPRRCRSRMPRSSSRWPARSTRSTAATSSSTTSS